MRPIVNTHSNASDVTVYFLWDRWTPPEQWELWSIPNTDVRVVVGFGDPRPPKIPLIDLVLTPGWPVGPVEFAHANHRPGWHLFKFSVHREPIAAPDEQPRIWSPNAPRGHFLLRTVGGNLVPSSEHGYFEEQAVAGMERD